MRYLITGGCGFVGSNLGDEVLRKGGELFVVDNLSRLGGERNLEWLRSRGEFKFYHKDTRAAADLEAIVRDVRPDVVFHLAGQVAMTTSIKDPRLDFETNVVGGHNLLEAVRKHSRDSVVIYSSTNKVYGDMLTVRHEEKASRYVAPDFPRGFDEALPLDFQSPYGCSKGATDQYMLDYARVFGLNTVVFRHSSICGERQFSTYDQGWVGWFASKAIEAKEGRAAEPFTISGNGKQVRDLLFSADLARCYFSAVENIGKARGQVFNIGGGMENSLSLLELFSVLEKELGVELRYRELPWRTSDQKIFVADTAKAARILGWQPKVGYLEGIRSLLGWVRESVAA